MQTTTAILLHWVGLLTTIVIGGFGYGFLSMAVYSRVNAQQHLFWSFVPLRWSAGPAYFLYVFFLLLFLFSAIVIMSTGSEIKPCRSFFLLHSRFREWTSPLFSMNGLKFFYPTQQSVERSAESLQQLARGEPQIFKCWCDVRSSTVDPTYWLFRPFNINFIPSNGTP